jgi:DNA-binding GntR family transcriptional regulator
MSIRVEPVTILDQAIGKLRSAIMSGELRPGARLLEAELCLRMGISRSSLREALRSLATEKLIHIVPNRGHFVTRLDARSVDDIHEVWSILTTQAVGRFATCATQEDLKLMRSAIRSLQEAEGTHDVAWQHEVIYEFFRIVYQRCNNRVLSETIYTLLSRIHVLRAVSMKQSNGQARVREIQAIVRALGARDAEAAMRAVREHIDSACRAAKEVCQMTAEHATAQ